MKGCNKEMKSTSSLCWKSGVCSSIADPPGQKNPWIMSVMRD